MYEDAENVLHISDVPLGVSPEVGAHCTDANVNNALDIVSGLTTELADQVILQLMEENPGTIAYINVRVVDRPTWRSL